MVCSLKMTLLVERPQSTWFQTRNWRQKKKTGVQAYPSPRKKLVQFRVQKIVFFPWSHYCNKPIGATKMPSKGTTIRIVIDPFAIVHLGDVSKGWIKSRLILKTITQFQNRDRQFHCFSHLIQFQKITRYRRHWNNWNGFFIQSFPTERYVECGQKLVDVFSQFQSNQAIQNNQLLSKEYFFVG